MSTKLQSEYISDLVVIKTKEFKEVKELIVSNNIVGEDANIVKNANNLDEITHALTDKQASALIDTLINSKTPNRSNSYSKKRMNSTISSLDNIKNIISNWNFK